VLCWQTTVLDPLTKPSQRQMTGFRMPPQMLAAVKSGAAQMRGVNLGSWIVLEAWMVSVLTYQFHTCHPDDNMHL